MEVLPKSERSNFNAASSVSIASLNETQNQSSESEKNSVEIRINKFESTSSVSSSEASEVATIQNTTFASETLPFNKRNFHNDDEESNDSTFESSRILSVLSSSSEVAVSNSLDIINLTTVEALSESLSMSVEESKTTAADTQTETTNDIAEKPSSDTLSLSKATRQRLAARKLSRRARFNKTPSGIVTESISSSSSSDETSNENLSSSDEKPSDIQGHLSFREQQSEVKDFDWKQSQLETSDRDENMKNEENIYSVVELQSSKDSSAATENIMNVDFEKNSDLKSKAELESVSSKSVASQSESFKSAENQTSLSSFSTLTFTDFPPTSMSSFISHSSQEVGFAKVETVEQIASSIVSLYSSHQEAFPSHESFTAETSGSSRKFRFLQEIDDSTSSISLGKSFLESDALEVSHSNQLEISAAKETESISSFSLSGKLPKSTEPSSEDKKSSSAAENVVPLIQTFQTKQSLSTTKGQDTSGALNQITEAIFGEDEKEDFLRENEDDEAGEDDVEEFYARVPKPMQ